MDCLNYRFIQLKYTFKEIFTIQNSITAIYIYGGKYCELRKISVYKFRICLPIESNTS